MQPIFNELLLCASKPGSSPQETSTLISNQENSEEYDLVNRVEFIVLGKCMEGIPVPHFTDQLKSPGDLKDAYKRVKETEEKN